MSWQEELRKLDEELAAGRLSADDYRVRRDQVLSSAVTQGESGSAAQGGAGQSGQPGQSGQSADSTQVISPLAASQGNQGNQAGSAQVGGSSEAERTQAVSPTWQAQPPSWQGQYQQAHPASPAGGFQQLQQPQQPWNTPDEDANPPWGGSEFPPLSAHDNSAWAAQGPESFDAPSRKRGGRIAAIVVVVVLVLAGLGVGGYFLFANSGDDEQADPSQTSASQPEPAPKPLTPEERFLASVPKPPGTQDQNSGLHTVRELRDLDLLGAEEAEVISGESTGTVAWRGSRKQPNEFGPEEDQFSVMAIPVSNGKAADALVKDLTRYHTDNKAVEIKDSLPNIPGDVVFLKKTAESPGVYLGFWVSGDKVIRIEVTQDPLDNEAALSGSYQRAVKSMLGNFPIAS